MEKHISELSPGDMIVHIYYGVGQIEAIDHKLINGVEVECFKVKTNNAVYWVPTDYMDNPRVHPVASQEQIKDVIEILQSAPHGQKDNPLQWEERINKILKDGDLLSLSRLVRDLTSLKINKKLSRPLTQALGKFQGQLLREWAASSEVDENTIKPQLQACLKMSEINYQNAV